MKKNQITLGGDFLTHTVHIPSNTFQLLSSAKVLRFCDICLQLSVRASCRSGRLAVHARTVLVWFGSEHLALAAGHFLVLLVLVWR